MKKIILLAVLAVSFFSFIFLPACGPRLSEQEAFAELERLPPDELNAVLAGNDRAITGQAFLNTELAMDLFMAADSIRWESCADGDGGINYERPGELAVEYYYYGKKGRQTYVDHCLTAAADYAASDYAAAGDTAADYLVEYYCKDKMYAKTQTLCKAGCENGACRPVPIVILE